MKIGISEIWRQNELKNIRGEKKNRQLFDTVNENNFFQV